jgi:hypothetical protein
MVVSVPWAHPGTGKGFTMLWMRRAQCGDRPKGLSVLADGNLPNPVQVSDLRAACAEGMDCRFERSFSLGRSPLFT